MPSVTEPVIIESVAEPKRMDAGPTEPVTEPVTEPEIEPAMP